MINHGLSKGYREANALVAKSNITSQKLLEKHNFVKLFMCNYYNIELEKLQPQQATTTGPLTLEQLLLWIQQYNLNHPENPIVLDMNTILSAPPQQIKTIIETHINTETHHNNGGNNNNHYDHHDHHHKFNWNDLFRNGDGRNGHTATGFDNGNEKDFGKCTSSGLTCGFVKPTGENTPDNNNDNDKSSSDDSSIHSPNDDDASIDHQSNNPQPGNDDSDSGSSDNGGDSSSSDGGGSGGGGGAVIK